MLAILIMPAVLVVVTLLATAAHPMADVGAARRDAALDGMAGMTVSIVYRGGVTAAVRAARVGIAVHAVVRHHSLKSSASLRA